jgi:hypothetical protein
VRPPAGTAGESFGLRPPQEGPGTAGVTEAPFRSAAAGPRRASLMIYSTPAGLTSSSSVTPHPDSHTARSVGEPPRHKRSRERPTPRARSRTDTRYTDPAGCAPASHAHTTGSRRTSAIGVEVAPRHCLTMPPLPTPLLPTNPPPAPGNSRIPPTSTSHRSPSRERADRRMDVGHASVPVVGQSDVELMVIRS